MHYYQHHIGDFIKDTANLDDHQLATYMRLIWAYYTDEKPITGALEDIAFAMRSDEKTVRLLLRHYFTEANDGWVHARCEREITEFHSKAEKARASANSRWKNKKGMRSESERNANASKDDANAADFNANQEPRTKNQEPNIKPKKASPSDYVFDEAWLLYPKRPGASKAESLKAWMARVKAGVDRTVMLEGVKRYASYCKATIEDPSFIKQPATFFGPNEHYLSDWSIPDQPKPAKKEDKSWMFTEAGIEAKAQELGISATGYDTYETLKEKCRRRIVEKAVA